MGGNSMWVASVGDTFDVDATAKQAITLTITKVVAGANPPISAKVGDKLSGIYEDKSGYYQVTDYKYLALSTPGGTTPADFDAGMKDLEFVLVKCHKTGSTCDFTKAQVPEQ